MVRIDESNLGCCGRVVDSDMTQEFYPTKSPLVKQRVYNLKRSGYDVHTTKLGSQTTIYGRIQITRVLIEHRGGKPPTPPRNYQSN